MKTYYSIKYCLTTGIVKVKYQGEKFVGWHRLGKDLFTSEEEAQAAVQTVIKNKIVSIEKQLDRLKASLGKPCGIVDHD